MTKSTTTDMTLPDVLKFLEKLSSVNRLDQCGRELCRRSILTLKQEIAKLPAVAEPVLSDLQSTILSIVQEYSEFPATLSQDFTNDLYIDSLDTVEIVMEVESRYEIQIPDHIAEDFCNGNDIVAYIEKNR